MTRNGEQILDIINRSTDHLTAEQIFFQMKQIAPKIVLATVYNNLNMFIWYVKSVGHCPTKPFPI